MKRLVSYTSLALIVACLVALIGELSPHDGSVAKLNSAGADTRLFSVGEARTVSFDIDKENVRQLSLRERRDQAIDWLMLTSLVARGAAPLDLRKLVFDLPPARYGYFRGLGTMEFGSVRSRDIGNGHVLVLIPAEGTPERKADRLARAFDDQWKNRGSQPEVLEVFEYRLDLPNDRAMLTRREDVAGAALTGAEYGYVESDVHTVADLQELLARIDDIVFVKSVGTGLTLGGRKAKAGSHLGVSLEDVAALWQSDKKIQERLKQFDAEWNGKAKAITGLANSSHWSQEKYDKAIEDLRAEESSAAHQLRMVSGSGFSLDPATDYDRVRESFMSVTVRSGMLNPSNPGSSSLAKPIAAAYAGLNQHDDTAFFEFLKALEVSQKNGADFAKTFLRCVYTRNQYQAARYDGELQGTEVGMVLFYTDLLAKLWALDYQSSTPTDKVAEFPSMLKDPISSVFRREEEEFSGTRLWFGTNNAGFQSVDSGTALVMGRIASRVYAASSDPLEPGAEKEAAAWSAGFLSWWNDHYEEVAAFEPQYQRLNEIMKWSLVLSWLNKGGYTDRLAFLADVPVKRNNVFPEWVRAQPELRFRQWDSVKFYPTGYLGSQTEALPRLFSGGLGAGADPCGQQVAAVGHYLSGGVSLADRSLFEERLSAPIEASSELRRSSLNWKDSEVGLGKFKTFDGIEVDLSDAADVRIRPPSTLKLRGRDGDVAPVEARYALAANDESIHIEPQLEGTSVGKLSIERQRTGFAVRWRSGDVDKAESLARDLSLTKDNVLDVLKAREDLQAIARLPGAEGYLVRFQGSERWIQLAPETEPTASIAAGWKARVSDLRLGRRNINVAWHDADAAMKLMPQDGYVEFVRQAEGLPLLADISTVPRSGADSAVVEIAYGGRVIHGSFARGEGVLQVPLRNLADAKLSLNDAQQAFEAVDPKKLSAARSGSGPLRFDGNGGEPPRPGSGTAGFMDWNENRLLHGMIGDPRAIKAQLDSDLSARLAAIDDSIKHRDYDAALSYLDDGRKAFGDHPELELREGLVRLYANDARQASQHFRDVGVENRFQRDRIFEELDARISEEQIAGQQERLGRLYDYLAWKARPELEPAVGHMDLLADDTGHFKLALLLDHDHIKMEPVSAGDAIPEHSRLYVEDSPGLNNVDWSTSPTGSLHEVLASGRGRLYRLSSAKIGAFQPDQISLAQVAHPAKAASRAPRASALRSLRPTGPGNTSSSCSGTNANSPDCTNAALPDENTYILVDNRQA